MRNIIAPAAIIALLAGCGGGGGGSAFMPGAQVSTQQGGPLAVATLNGATGFVAPSGLTAYVFDADLAAPGRSTCNGACAVQWPPIVAPSGALPEPFGVIARSDGTSELTYAGRPLYTYIGDSRAGQTNGDGIDAFGGLWHIARPQGSVSQPSPSASPSGGY
jgi:predicted lipoprotein with Yx(FWY)xxD motif